MAEVQEMPEASAEIRGNASELSATALTPASFREREIEILRREKEIAERELQLVRRELELARGMQ